MRPRPPLWPQDRSQRGAWGTRIPLPEQKPKYQTIITRIKEDLG